MNVYFEMLCDLGVVDERLRPPPLVQERAMDPSAIDHPLVADFKYTSQCSHFTPIHRYSRKARFKWTLVQLLNVSCPTSVELQVVVARELKKGKVSTFKIWNQTRAILKRTGYSRKYILIPNLIHACTGLRIHIPHGAIDACLRDFDAIEQQFNFGYAFYTFGRYGFFIFYFFIVWIKNGNDLIF